MSQLGLDYPTKWGRDYTARLIRLFFHAYVLAPAVRAVAKLQVHGDEDLKSIKTPLVFAANHTTHLDTAFMITALPARLRNRTVIAAAMDTFFMKSGKAFRTVLFFNAIPVDRQKVNRRSAQQALDLLEDGWNLLIFPEGGRSPDGTLREFKTGAAFLAQRAGATVVPTYIHNAGYVWPKKFAKAPMFRNDESKGRRSVEIYFGLPITCGPDEPIREFGTRIENAVLDIARRVTGDPHLEITRSTMTDEE